jgi:hypothetical protein
LSDQLLIDLVLLWPLLSYLRQLLLHLVMVWLLLCRQVLLYLQHLLLVVLLVRLQVLLPPVLPVLQDQLEVLPPALLGQQVLLRSVLLHLVGH